MPSLFTRIINRDLPAHIVAETDSYIAFLDIHPLAKGHTLAVPRKEVDALFDLDDETLAGLMLFAKQVGQGIQKAIPCLRVGVAVVGLEVPHAHLHLVPINGPYDIDFQRPRLQFSTTALSETARQLRATIELAK